MKETAVRIPDRFVIDDGRHLVRISTDREASAAAGAVLFRATCSCGLMDLSEPMDHHAALRAHMGHVETRIGPQKGPAWLPEGARIIMLMVAMMSVWAGIFIAGYVVARGLDGTAADLTRAAFTVMGMGAAFTLMVGMRRYIAPTRA